MTLLIRAALLMIAMVPARAAMAQELRVAVVDLQGLAVGTIEGQKATDQLEKRYQEISAIMQKAQKDIEDKQTRLTGPAGRTLSETARTQLQREIEQGNVDLSRKNEDYQRELAAMEEELMQPIIQKAQIVLDAYVREKGFNLLLNWTAEGSNVIWVNRGNDITADVIKRIDADTTPVTPPTAAR